MFFFLFQPHQECPSGTSVRSLVAAGYAVRPHAAAGGGGGRAWPQTLAERHWRHGGREGTPRQSPGTPSLSHSQSIQDGSSFIFCIVHVCFSTHVPSDPVGPLVQSLNFHQKANSSPPWGLALNLLSLYLFWGTPDEAVLDKARGSPPSLPAR